MNILIRCDMGGSHGLGHIIRCKALAQELYSRGCEVGFVSDTTDCMEPFVAPLPCTHISSPGYLECDVVIVDTKQPIAESWYRQFGDALLAKIVRIDHPHATPDSCDLLIGPVAHWAPETVAGLCASFGERFLYGWDYVMLAPEVAQRTVLPYGYRTEPSMVFYAGGSDPENMLEQMYAWFGHSILPDVPKTFLVGCNHKTELASKVRWAQADGKSCFNEGRFCRIAPFQREHLRTTSLAIGPLGVSTYECLYYRTPVISIERNNDDAAMMRAFEKGWLTTGKTGISPVVSIGNTLSEGLLEAKIMRCWRNPYYRHDMSDAMSGLMDGLGIQRIADAILAL